MSGFARSFDSKFNIENGQFEAERDTSRPMFYTTELLVNGELKTVEMVEIRGPGEALNVYAGKVREEDRQRWPKEYEAFKRGEESLIGTPLSKWPAVNTHPQTMATLRALGYMTVEDVARMPDGAVNQFHGADVWRKKAQNFVVEQQKLAAATEQDENNRRLAEMSEQIAALQAQLAAKKPGRKPKAEVAA